MPEFQQRADTQTILVAHFRREDAATATIIGTGDTARVGRKIATDFPQGGRQDLQLARTSGTDTDPETAHLERAVIQLNAYGATDTEASALWRAADLWLRQARAETHDGAVITLVEKLTGPTADDDPATGAPRYLSSYAVYVHPTPAA